MGEAKSAGRGGAAPSRLIFGLRVSESGPLPFEEAVRALRSEAVRHLPGEGRILVLSHDFEQNGLRSWDRKDPVVLARPGDPPPAGPFDALWVDECVSGAGGPAALVDYARAVLKPGAVLVVSGPVRYGPGSASWPSGGDQAAGLAEGGFCILNRERMGGRLLVGTIREGVAGSNAIAPEGAGDFPSGRSGYEILAARKEERFVRAYRPGDEAEILALFREQFHADRSAAHFRWKYLENPHGGPCMSLLFSEQGRLLAHYAGYPVPFRIGDARRREDFTVMHVGDTMTRPEGRRVGLGATSVLARATLHFYARYLEETASFAYGFNTGRIRRFGSRYMEYGYLEPVSLWSRAVGEGTGTPVRRAWGRWRVQRITSMSDEFDRFFDWAAPRYGLLARRDAAYLTWRYLRRPDRPYAVYAVRRWGRLRGWGVFAGDPARLLWGDALFDTEDPGALEALLGAALEEAPGAGSIQAWFSPRPEWWSRLLDRCGFVSGAEPRGLSFCYKMFSRPDQEDALKKNLYYAWGDGDLF